MVIFEYLVRFEQRDAGKKFFPCIPRRVIREPEGSRKRSPQGEQ